MSKQLELLKAQCIALVEYLERQGGGAMMAQYTSVIETQYAQGNERGLRTIVRDLSEWASGLSKDGPEAVAQLLAISPPSAEDRE